jgi:hypothetical protein
MPYFSSPQSCIKPYENRHGRLIKTPFLPTLKPEELKFSQSGCNSALHRITQRPD